MNVNHVMATDLFHISPPLPSFFILPAGNGDEKMDADLSLCNDLAPEFLTGCRNVIKVYGLKSILSLSRTSPEKVCGQLLHCHKGRLNEQGPTGDALRALAGERIIPSSSSSPSIADVDAAARSDPIMRGLAASNEAFLGVDAHRFDDILREDAADDKKAEETAKRREEDQKIVEAHRRERNAAKDANDRKRIIEDFAKKHPNLAREVEEKEKRERAATLDKRRRENFAKTVAGETMLRAEAGAGEVSGTGDIARVMQLSNMLSDPACGDADDYDCQSSNLNVNGGI